MQNIFAGTTPQIPIAMDANSAAATTTVATDDTIDSTFLSLFDSPAPVQKVLVSPFIIPPPTSSSSLPSRAAKSPAKRPGLVCRLARRVLRRRQHRNKQKSIRKTPIVKLASNVIYESASDVTSNAAGPGLDKRGAHASGGQGGSTDGGHVYDRLCRHDRAARQQPPAVDVSKIAATGSSAMALNGIGRGQRKQKALQLLASINFPALPPYPKTPPFTPVGLLSTPPLHTKFNRGYKKTTRVVPAAAAAAASSSTSSTRRAAATTGTTILASDNVHDQQMAAPDECNAGGAGDDVDLGGGDFQRNATDNHTYAAAESNMYMRSTGNRNSNHVYADIADNVDRSSNHGDDGGDNHCDDDDDYDEIVGVNDDNDLAGCSGSEVADTLGELPGRNDSGGRTACAKHRRSARGLVIIGGRPSWITFTADKPRRGASAIVVPLAGTHVSLGDSSTDGYEHRVTHVPRVQQPLSGAVSPDAPRRQARRSSLPAQVATGGTCSTQALGPIRRMRKSTSVGVVPAVVNDDASPFESFSEHVNVCFEGNLHNRRRCRKSLRDTPFGSVHRNNPLFAVMSDLSSHNACRARSSHKLFV